MFSFLKDPASNMRSFGSGRKMPNLNLSDEEARSVIAFLKWMSSIDTNGFPYRFRTIQQEARK
jgi:nitric oxide reductase subunit C